MCARNMMEHHPEHSMFRFPGMAERRNGTEHTPLGVFRCSGFQPRLA